MSDNKYEVIIKNKTTGKEVDRFVSNHVLGTTENGNFTIGNPNYVERLTLLATLLESQFLNIIQEGMQAPTAQLFEELPKYYSKEVVLNARDNIRTMMSMLSSAVTENLDEKIKYDKLKPDTKYKVQIVDSDNNVVKEKSTDFCLIASHDNGVSLFANTTDLNNKKDMTDEEMDNMLYQTICNAIHYAAKVSVALLSDYSIDEICDKIEKGDLEITNEVIGRAESYYQSVRQYSREQRIINKLHNTDAKYVIDEEEYAKQIAMSQFNKFMNKMMGNDGLEDEDEDSE
ncbi:MAG: hypothetical protein IJF92_00745 [Bacilli bacterium]|nr:hypothetical protein [Bacilli bacterium]MBQ3307658.1 hypothetical protein [Bacilli bacterium]